MPNLASIFQEVTTSSGVYSLKVGQKKVRGKAGKGERGGKEEQGERKSVYKVRDYLVR